jgi:hypothetical protein
VPGIWKKRQEGARLSQSVTVVKVVGARIIEIDGQLDKPKPENPRIEIEVLLGGSANRRHVVYPKNFTHSFRSPCRIEYGVLAVIIARINTRDFA